MGTYVTQEDCVQYGSAELLAQPELTDLLSRACDQVDAICFGRIQSCGMDQLTTRQQEKVKKAVCLHAAFLRAYGDALESPLESYGINGVSMSFAADRVIKQGGTTTSPEVYSLLLQSGLACRRLM